MSRYASIGPMTFAAVLLLAASSARAGVFPYPVAKRTLPNGLDIVVIETPEFKDVLSYNTLVMAGSRDEIEPGKSGLAHLFEHILFRHRHGGKDGGYDDAVTRLGVHNNAWTWFDVTYYWPTTFASNLEALAALEASRFTALDFTEKIFRTEAGAVLGEYRRSAANPAEKLEERLFALLYGAHPYGHTTIGYYEDVLDMPNEYRAARRFYEELYRPDNCALVVAGDVKADRVFAALEPLYRAWKARPSARPRPVAPPARGPKREHVPWDSDVAPIVWVGTRMPAFIPGSAESAAAQVLEELLVSLGAPLYKKMRYEKQTASALHFAEGSKGFESFEGRMLTVAAQLYKDKHAARGDAYLEEAAADIVAGLDDLKSFSARPDAVELLETVKSKYRYDFLASLTSPGDIASTFAWYYRFGRDPQALDRMLEAVARLTPRDVDRLAKAAFTPANRVVLSLAHKPGAGR